MEADEEEPSLAAAGHRERLRARALATKCVGMPDYELLELFLFRSIPQKDVKPVAKALLDRFGSLAGVLTASVEDIAAVKPPCLNPRTGKTERRGTGAAGALDLKLMHEATQRILKAEVAQRPVISSWSSLLDYVRTRFGPDKREQFHALFLDTRNRLIRDELTSEGSIDQAAVYVREVVRRALELGSASIILVHNHPSGDPKPSRADITLTRQVIDACRPLGISVHDHVIIGSSGHASLKSLGLI